MEWARDESTPTAYPVKLTVYCDDRFGMLKNITGVIGDAKATSATSAPTPRTARPASKLSSIFPI